MKKSIIILLISLFIGCTTVPTNTGLSNIWSDLQPYSRNFDDSGDNLRKILSSYEHRYATMSFVEKTLENDVLSWKDQFRLAAITRILQQTAVDGEYDRICRLINLGKKHPTYYAYANWLIGPNFFLCAIEILKKQTYIAPLFNPDGGKIENRNILPSTIRRLEKATGLDYGHNYDKWKEWWVSTGQHLRYNKKLETYE